MSNSEKLCCSFLLETISEWLIVVVFCLTVYVWVVQIMFFLKRRGHNFWSGGTKLTQFCYHLTMHLTSWRHYSYTDLCLQTAYHRLAQAFVESQSFFLMSVNQWLYVIFRVIPLIVEKWPQFVDLFNRKDAVFSYHCFHISSVSLFFNQTALIWKVHDVEWSSLLCSLPYHFVWSLSFHHLCKQLNKP